MKLVKHVRNQLKLVYTVRAVDSIDVNSLRPSDAYMRQ